MPAASACVDCRRLWMCFGVAWLATGDSGAVEQWSNWQGESSPTCCITVFDSADVASNESNVHVICISGHLLLQQMHQKPWGYCSRTPHGRELLTQWLLVFRRRWASIAA